MKPVWLFIAPFVVSCSAPSPGGDAASSAGQPSSVDAVERKMIALLEKFDRYDYNGDGRLTRDEIRNGAREAEMHEVSARELDRAFAFYDTNRDGFISLAEANAGFRRGPEAFTS